MTHVLSAEAEAEAEAASSPLPPRRPRKSRLRTLSTIDQMSTYSVRSLSPSELSSPCQGDDTIVKSNNRVSRFKEHFDHPQARSLTTITSSSASSSLQNIHMLNRSSSSSSCNRRIFFDATFDKRHQPPSSTSTPLELLQPHKNTGTNGSVLMTKSSNGSHPNNMSLNRADFIISRLETWHDCLKSVTSWVEETAKISLQSSRGFSQKAYPYIDHSLQDSVNESIRTIQAGFRALTMQMAAEQQAFSQCLERDHLPDLFKLQRQVKDTVYQLKNDPALGLDEFLRRAEATQSKITHLGRCCNHADSKANAQVEMDPWLANILVLRQLKRQIEEENRLRLLMIPIQRNTEEFEQQAINQIKCTLEYCYEILAPDVWDGSADKDAAPFELVMKQIMTQQSWKQFVQENKANIVDEKNPTKDFLKINYPNRRHPLVMELFRGKMERKVGVRKQFIERNFVLSKGGYLHQFSLEDKVLSPEKTIYIPNKAIVSSIDLNEIDSILTEYIGDTSNNTFEICKHATTILQRDKVFVFRTSTRAELVTWCRMLGHISLSSLGVSLDLKNSSTSFDHASTVQMIRLGHCFDSIDIKKLTDSPTGSPSPTRSLKSAHTEESFNEPAAYSKSPTPPSTMTTFVASTPITDVIVEEEINSIDAESFVTAHPFEDGSEADEVDDDDDDNVQQDTDALIDYFHPKISKIGNDADTLSIASSSTAKI